MSYLKNKPGSLEEVISQKTRLEAGYQQMIKKELEKAGKGIGSMTPKEKSAFFNKIDKMHTAKNEQAKEPYAIGMASAMKQTGDNPPLKKSTITKAHDIAKSIEKDMKKEEVSQKKIDKFHTSLDKLVHKSFGHSSDEKKKEMKKETHSFVTNKMNQSKKDAPGEKQVVDPEPKLKEPKTKVNFKEMYGKISASKKKMKEDDSNQNKTRTDTGEKPSEIDLKPQIKYSR